MTENQKLREALELGWKMAANWSLSDHLLADMESPAYLTERDGLLQALATTEPVMENGLTEAETDATASVMGLATTEPEPTGVPELHPVAHIELGDDSHDVVTLDAAKAYGEQCWRAGYKHGAWGDKPAVNQQLTTEPLDERAAFEREMSCEEIWGHRSLAKKTDGRYGNWCVDLMWAVWQARAAIEKSAAKEPAVPEGAVGFGARALAAELAEAALKDDQDPEGHDISAGLFGPNVSEWLRKVAREYLAAPSQEPEPLSDEQINKLRIETGFDPDDLPDPWSFAQGVRHAERAHGILPPSPTI